MRTRRSPRNQQILWNDLGGPKPEKKSSNTVESLERQLATAKADPFCHTRMIRMIERQLTSAKMKTLRKSV